MRDGTGLVEEGVVERVDVSVLGVAVWITITIGVAIHVAVLVTLAEPLLEEGGDIIDYSTELLVTVCFGCLEATSDMSANKRHGYSVRARGMEDCGRGGRVDVGGQDEGTWGLTTRDVGHVEEERRGRIKEEVTGRKGGRQRTSGDGDGTVNCDR